MRLYTSSDISDSNLSEYMGEASGLCRWSLSIPSSNSSVRILSSSTKNIGWVIITSFIVF